MHLKQEQQHHQQQRLKTTRQLFFIFHEPEKTVLLRNVSLKQHQDLHLTLEPFNCIENCSSLKKTSFENQEEVSNPFFQNCKTLPRDWPRAEWTSCRHVCLTTGQSRLRRSLAAKLFSVLERPILILPLTSDGCRQVLGRKDYFWSS